MNSVRVVTPHHLNAKCLNRIVTVISYRAHGDAHQPYMKALLTGNSDLAGFEAESVPNELKSVKSSKPNPFESEG
jgi:hypothetical protein